MEFHLRLTKPDPPKKKKQGAQFDPAWKSYDLPKIDPLPPISKKPQVCNVLYIVRKLIFVLKNFFSGSLSDMSKTPLLAKGNGKKGKIVKCNLALYFYIKYYLFP